MLYGIFHNGLQRQRRYRKRGIRGIKINKEQILKLDLFHSEVGTGMFQFLRKWDRFLTC